MIYIYFLNKYTLLKSVGHYSKSDYWKETICYATSSQVLQFNGFYDKKLILDLGKGISG